MLGSTSSFSPPRPNPTLNLSAKGQGGDRQDNLQGLAQIPEDLLRLLILPRKVA